MRFTSNKIIFNTILLILSLFMLVIGFLAIAIIFTFPRLPNLTKITNYEPSMPLRIYSNDNVLIGVYGQEKRTFTKIQDFPPHLIYAVLAAEDKRFYKHNGVDLSGIMRALISNIISGEAGQGASTITQQIAKNFYLSNEKTFKRKFIEALLSFKIEMTLSKDEILELYFNQIYLGQSAYGFASAAKIYFNKLPNELTIAEAAVLAGLPKAPSAFNPFVNPDRAKKRQLYVLRNMLKEGRITKEQYDQAVAEKLVYKITKTDIVDENSLYVAEMVRKQLHDKYGDEIYKTGYRVYTTVKIPNQKAATQALRNTLLSNSVGKPFVGAEAYYNIANLDKSDFEGEALKILSRYHTVDKLVPALVIEANSKQVTLLIESQKDPIILTGASLNFIKKAINNNKMGDKKVATGAIIRVTKNKNNNWTITQLPELEGSIISIDSRTGAIQAVAGGFNFYAKQFNRATQAYRQPGSTFKPFVYSAALEKGMTASTIINDAPISFGKYHPKNSNGKFSGPITIREAIYRSKNVVAIRVINSIGARYAHNYIQKFGFAPQNHPIDLSLILGSGAASPLEMARAYAVFSNGGFKVEPYIIDKIYNSHGQLIAQTKPLIAGVNAPRVIDPSNAFIMYKLLQDVVQFGTATQAKSLGRKDIAGKTGTTNEQKDAWFIGFNTQIVTAVYVGYDRPKSMGSAGYGGRIALPIWIDYMKIALKNVPDIEPKKPKNVVARGVYYYQKNNLGKMDIKIDNSSTDPAYQQQNNTILDNLF